jgi:hypothetical protein
MKRDLYGEIDPKAKDEKKSQELEKEWSSHVADRPKMEAAADSLDPEILAANDEYDKAVSVKNRPKAEAAAVRLQTAKRKKDSIKDEYHRHGEQIRASQETLMAPYHEEALSVLDREIERVSKQYVFTIPPVRTNSKGEVIETPWMEEYKDFGKQGEITVRYCFAHTNAAAIQGYRNACVSAKLKIRACMSLGALQAVLGDLQAELAKIDLEPQKTRIAESDLDRANVSNVSEMAFITDKGEVVKVKPTDSKTSSDLFRVPK